MEYLQSASRVLTRQQLRDAVACSHLLQTEFMVSLTTSFKSGLFYMIGTTENWGKIWEEKIIGQHFNVKVQFISKGQIR